MLSDVSNEPIAFGDYRLDPAERRLTRAGEPVELSGRYLDALLLLARNPGLLITKDRFMGEVWRGVPVTDEALTQCVRSLRKTLGDEAGRPRFIETVPKHGYRFVADVSPARSSVAAATDVGAAPRRSAQADLLLVTTAGLAGGAAAGLIGGIAYGLLAASEPPAGTGAISVVLVITCLCLLVGLLGGLGVGAGIAVGRQLPGARLFPLMAGGALGGLVIGSLGRLVGVDAFTLLIGSRPLAITGGSEGLIIGALAGAAAWSAFYRDNLSPARCVAIGAALGAGAGLLVTLGGGQMMAGSLAVLATTHPQAPLGSLLAGLSSWAHLISGAVEGATFVAALTLAFSVVRRSRVAA